MAVLKTKTQPENTFINPCKKPLTADKLIRFKGCENIPPDEVQAIVESLEMLAVLLLELSTTNEKKK
jgi:hypothetical protein